MIMNRRAILVAGAASLIPARAFGQPGPDPSEQWPIDGGRWCPTPDFGPILSGVAAPLKVVSGWRPERRVGDQAKVRLEKVVESGRPTIIHNYGHCGSGVTLGLGCASLVERSLAQSQTIPKDSRITVVGAGIIGLTTAFVLKRRGYTNVTIQSRVIASGDFDRAATVSDIAGGQFEAAGIDDISGGLVPGADRVARMGSVLKETLDVLTETRGDLSDPFLFPGYVDRYVYTVVRNYTNRYMNVPTGLSQASAAVMQNAKLRQSLVDQYGPLALGAPRDDGVIAPFRLLQKGRPAPVLFGVRNTILINTANLISNIKRYLLSPAMGPRTAMKVGREFIVSDFAGLQALDADVVINCTGLGGVVLGGPDPGASMTGRYGLLAKLPRPDWQFRAKEPRYLYSGFGYMFPRSDGTIVGGAWDDQEPYGLPGQSVDEILGKSAVGRAAYFNSLRTDAALDLDRSQKMVTAVGLFFLGRNNELNPLQSELTWMSGSGQFKCASDPTGCHM